MVEKDKKYIHYPNERSCADFKNPKAEAIYKESLEDPAKFWAKRAEELHWHKKYTQTIDTSDKYLHRWFPDGEINICYNAVDRHVKAGRGDEIAFLEDSVYTGHQAKWTYRQIQAKTGQLASIYKKQFKIEAGDRVLIYMPMTIEAAIAMLACARIGAIHSVVFGGFAPKELATRIDDCNPKLLVVSSCGIEPGKHLKYVPMVEEALGHCKDKDSAKLIPRLLHQRLELDGKLKETGDLDKAVYFDFDELMSKEKEVAECVPLLATHPLYILYTSGTTGQPKGIVRDTGGTTVGLNFCMQNVFNVHPGSVHFAGSDIGWVVGHSFIVYGPLIRGATSVFFEGKPITPNPGIIWKKVEEYKVTSLYMAPTAVRVIKKEDYEGEWVKKYDTSTINSYALVGERCDPDTIWWINRHLPHVIINDTWWQTETGWPICCNLLNEKEFGQVYPTLPGSVTRPVPSYDVRIFSDDNKQCKPNELGKVVIKMPLPPSFMLTLWGNDEAFIQKYLADTPGYYTTGDAGIIDENGYLSIMTRVDDVINTCGHRISTGRLEEVVNEYEGVVESAVVGYDEEIRGECPLAFVVLKGKGTEGMSDDEIKKLKTALNDKVRKDVGAFCRLIGVIFMEKLPKTKSGKILRGTIRKICNGREYPVPATIDDMSSLKMVEDRSKAWRDSLPK